ncbi:MAG TPA: HAMP domain-containing sensor histidine kinase [Phycisphaerae bacterium]|nr:HAMP domain-containing sensor histidine kinase [Phycisphaerae bacterium]HRW55102.1 HAMP domain-containing sensor histidine kinase [Phycisphaerae bacterium]
MHFPHTISRRSVLLVLCSIVVLALSGMIWATHTTLQLDAERRMAKLRDQFDYDFSIAMYRLDGIDWQFRQEKNHSFDIFKPFYRPPRAFDPVSGVELTRPVLIPSPLQTLDGPDWLLLHFQAMWPEGWDCPQVGPGDDFAQTASLFPADERRLLATPANWLTALRAAYDPLKLQELLEDAQLAYMKEDVVPGPKTRVDPEPRPDDTDVDRALAHSRAVQEFNLRGARLLERQGRHIHTEACERQSIIWANLVPGQDPSVDLDRDEECRAVEGTEMIPVWLDLTLDGSRQLALMRSVSLPRTDVTEPTCVVQGVLFDWDRLREALEQAVLKDNLLPGARIEPRDASEPTKPNHLHTIPAKLVADMPIPADVAAASYDVLWGLGLTWVVLLGALGGIVYGTLKYLGLLERRMRFTAAVTHELRTPLTSFQLYTDLLSDLDDDDRELRSKYLSTLRSESKRLSNLVENVLVYSRVNEATTRIHSRPVTPGEILNAVSEETARRCEECERTLLISDKTGSKASLETDPEFVRQILASLVDNACKYSDVKGPIWIDATTPRGGGVLFEVDDAGRGVDPSETREIFEPFRRGRDADTGRTGGMGLGLALSRYWAACLDGRLSVRRSNRNGGHYSMFALELPSRPRQA